MIAAIFTVIFLISAILSLTDSLKGNKIIEGAGLLSFLGLFACLLNALIKSPQPTAMDVYQGKTTLQITYVDSIPVDSVVVWKK